MIDSTRLNKKIKSHLDYGGIEPMTFRTKPLYSMLRAIECYLKFVFQKSNHIKFIVNKVKW